MSATGLRWLSLAAAVVCAGAMAGAAAQTRSGRVLDEYPSIAYAKRPTTDRIARLSAEVASGTRMLPRDARTGYLLPVLQALGIPTDSQVLVFSKTGIQSAYTNPHHPRSLFFDQSVVVGYIPGAPALELAAHDPQQGVVFYTVEQLADAPAFTRRTNCLMCHVSSSTLDVPGIIARSNMVDDRGAVLPNESATPVDHTTPHPDRWGGWFVTSQGAPPPYSQRAHLGNITFSGHEITSNQVMVDWLSGSPEAEGYLSATSDVVALLLFDHQAKAINLMTRVNWEYRAAAAGEPAAPDAERRGLAIELADYLLFDGEAPMPVPLTAPAGLAAHLAGTVPKDSRGRSLGQLELNTRLLRYPCSYMIYTDAFNALPAAAKDVVYGRMLDVLTGKTPRRADSRLSPDDRSAILEILRETKSDFPR